MKGEFANKTYTFTVTNEDTKESKSVSATTNWEGLKVWELLNLFRLFILQIGYSDSLARGIRSLTEAELEELGYSADDIAIADYHEMR